MPLQNHDATRRKTYEAKLWVYAKDDRHGPPLIVCAFSKSRTRDAPLTFLKDYRGHLQADEYPGYDPLYLSGKIMEVACNVHARRRFVEAADLLKTPGSSHEAPAFYREHSALPKDSLGARTPLLCLNWRMGRSGWDRLCEENIKR